eukprot:jgi/Psemu1/51513/gm1.51513_g
MGCQGSKISDEDLARGLALSKPTVIDDFLDGLCCDGGDRILLDAHTQTEPTKQPLLTWMPDSDRFCCDGICLRPSTPLAETEANPAAVDTDADNEADTGSDTLGAVESSSNDPDGTTIKSESCCIDVENETNNAPEYEAVDVQGNDERETGNYSDDTESVLECCIDAEDDASEVPECETIDVQGNDERETANHSDNTESVMGCSSTSGSIHDGDDAVVRVNTSSVGCQTVITISFDDDNDDSDTSDSEPPIPGVTASSSNREIIECETVYSESLCSESESAPQETTPEVSTTQEPEFKVKGYEIVLHRIEIQRRIEARRRKAFRDHVRRAREAAAEKDDHDNNHDNDDDSTVASCATAPVGIHQSLRIEARRRKAFEDHLRRRKTSQTRMQLRERRRSIGHDR